MSLKSPDPDDKWLVILAAVLAAIVFILPLTVRFPLLDPDEGLHASIAQEMVERGDWLTPHFLGEPFFDKPILYFWCQALSLRSFGMNEAAVRLPGLIFGLLGAITTGIVGRRMFGRTAGWISAIFYATMILPVAMAQAASHDVAIIPCINLAILFLWESDQTQSKSARWSYIAAAGFLLGLTILAKGLIGVALVGVAYGSYILITPRLSGRCKTSYPNQEAGHSCPARKRQARMPVLLLAVCLRGLAVLAIAAIVASPWFITVEIKHPGFLHYYFIERHFLGFVTATQMHGEAPWWYYLPILLGGGLPWIGYIPITISDVLARRVKNNYPTEIPGPSTNGAMTLLFSWLIGCTVLLSISHSKLATYIWPVFPAVAVLSAVGWARLLDGTLAENARRSLLRTFFLSSVTGPIVLPLLVFVTQKVFAVNFPWPVWIAAVLAGFAALIPLVFLKKHQWRAMLAASTLSTAVQFVAALTLVLPLVAENFTARCLAEHFNRAGRLPLRLLVAEERLGSLLFYLDPALRSGLKENQIGMIFYDQPADVPPGTIIALPELRAFQAHRYSDLAGLPYTTVGRYRLYELSGQQTKDRD